MSTNVEIKARAREPGKVRARAEESTDKPCETAFQEDTFFQTARGRLKLRVAQPGGSALIFYERRDELGPKQSDYLVCPIADPDSLKALLGACLGIRGVVRKERRLYMIGNTRVHLDDVEGLGQFLELEVMLRGNEDVSDGIAVAHSLMAKLGIEVSDLVEGAYIDLLESGGAQ